MFSFFFLFFLFFNAFGCPLSLVTILSPSCRLPVAFSALSAPCRSPITSLSPPCRTSIAPLLLLCRFPAALLSLSCRFLSLPVVFGRYATFCLAPSCRSPVALLSFLSFDLLSLFCVASLPPCCRLPFVFLSLPGGLPIASLSLPYCPTWYPVTLLSLACRLHVAFLSPSSRLPVASMLPPCRFLVTGGVTNLQLQPVVATFFQLCGRHQFL